MAFGFGPVCWGGYGWQTREDVLREDALREIANINKKANSLLCSLYKIPQHFFGHKVNLLESSEVVLNDKQKWQVFLHAEGFKPDEIQYTICEFPEKPTMIARLLILTLLLQFAHPAPLVETDGDQETINNKHREEAEPSVPAAKIRRPRLACPANENALWAFYEEGCTRLIPIRPGVCACREGMFRRESDRACVAKSECPATVVGVLATVVPYIRVCPVNEKQYFGTSEVGCNGQVSVRPGDCICGDGFYRRERDRACVTSCYPDPIIIPWPCNYDYARRYCVNYCAPYGSLSSAYCNPWSPGLRRSVTCNCDYSPTYYNYDG